MVAKGEGSIERLGWAAFHTVIHRMGKYQDLYSKGNYIHYAVINHSGKEYEKESVCVCVNHFAVEQR